MFKQALIIATLAAAAFTAPVATAAEPQSGIPVADYTVFVDPPTGFVFVKLPAGWRFAGKVSESDLARLPGGVVTALLKSEAAQAVAQRDAGARVR